MLGLFFLFHMWPITLDKLFNFFMLEFFHHEGEGFLFPIPFFLGLTTHYSPKLTRS